MEKGNSKEERIAKLKNGGFKSWLLVLAVVVMCGSFSTEVTAYGEKGFEVEFHGYFESNLIVRDIDGFNDGFLDRAELIQQRNTLKFDVDAYPKWGFGPFSVKKIHLTYRGAYDSIFQLREDEYSGIPDDQGSRFEYGQDDIEWENDLREAFVDVTYQGPLGSAFFRPGRQLVSWGEASGATILDRVNPTDGSVMVSAFPDDMKTPLWMGRLNYSIPPQPGFNMNIDLLVIPDVRPRQFAPLDPTMNAPYTRNTPFAGFAALWGNPFFMGVEEEVPTHRTEYAARVTTDIGANLSVSGVYISSANDNPAVMLTNMIDLGGGAIAPSAAHLEHPWTKTYGFSFNNFVPLFDIILKGEFGYTEDAPVSLASPDVVFPGSPGLDPNGNPWLPFNLQQYRLKDTYAGMIGFDKNWWWRWLSPDKMVGTTFQWIHQGIRDLDSDMKVNNKTHSDLFSGQIVLYYWNGRLSPVVFVMYDTEGNWMTNMNVKWDINTNWKITLDQLSFWGNEGRISGFSTGMGMPDGHEATDQIMFKVTYQW